MTTEELSEELKSKAINVGLCNLWQSEWGNPDKEELCDKYKRGIYFAIKNDYPGIDYIKAHFDEDFRHEHDVYIDEEISLTNPTQEVVILGKCKGTINITGFASARIFIAHTSEIKVKCSDISKAFVTTFNNSSVRIEKNVASRVFVYQYDNSSETHIGEIKLRKK